MDEAANGRVGAAVRSNDSGTSPSAPEADFCCARAAFDRRFDEAITRVWHVVVRCSTDRESAERQTAALLRELFSTLPATSSAAQFSSHLGRLLRAFCDEVVSKRGSSASLAEPS